MSDDFRDQRGPYTPPSEPPLAFDARRPVRGSGPAPVALIVSALVLIAVIAGVFFMYRGGLRGPNDAPQPVGAPVRDVKTAAPPEAQPQDPAAGLSVYKDDGAAAPATPTFAPPPEQPAPRPAPVTVQAAPPVQAAPAVRPASAPAAKPVVVAAAPAAPAPAAKPVAEPKPAKPAPTTAAATPTPKPAASGAAMVQIGAFSSAALADKGWNEAARVAPGAMAGKGKKVERVDVGGSTLFRTSITGFSSREAAVSLCDQLKAAGKTCFVK